MPDKSTDWAKWAVYAQLASDLSTAVGDLYEQVEKLQKVVTVLAQNQQDLEERLTALEWPGGSGLAVTDA